MPATGRDRNSPFSTLIYPMIDDRSAVRKDLAHRVPRHFLFADDLLDRLALTRCSRLVRPIVSTTSIPHHTLGIPKRVQRRAEGSACLLAATLALTQTKAGEAARPAFRHIQHDEGSTLTIPPHHRACLLGA